MLPFILTSCGYRHGYGSIAETYCTIDVPFAKGDATGAFTSELIRSISQSGGLIYDPVNPDLALFVDLVDYNNVNIGFRFDDAKDNGDPVLVPSETRRFVKAMVTLRNLREGCCIFGPDEITAFVDFDHEFNQSRSGINVESLGQVLDIDNATDQAAKPLNRALAQKIVDYIVNAWN